MASVISMLIVLIDIEMKKFYFTVTNCVFFIDQGTDVNAAIDGRSPLHFAADYGQRDVIEYLVSKKADVNVSNVNLYQFAENIQDLK